MKKLFALSLTLAIAFSLTRSGEAANEGFNTFVTGLSAATTPTGSELVPCVQSGATAKCTITQIVGDLSASNISTGTLPAGRLPALTGDVTSSAGSAATTIAAASVTLAKQANLAANSIVGNNTASPATPIALTATQVNTFLGVTINLTGTTGSIGGSLLAAGACSSGTVAVSLSTTSMAVIATPVTYPGDGNYWMAYVSAAGTVTVKVCAAIAGTPGASAYNVRVIQ
jgi:hypothetical protein